MTDPTDEQIERANKMLGDMIDEAEFRVPGSTSSFGGAMQVLMDVLRNICLRIVMLKDSIEDNND
jgi:hypothetical protein